MIIRMADKDGDPGGRPQYPGLTDPPPHERIDERRLPGSGGSADDREHGRFGILEPGSR